MTTKAQLLTVSAAAYESALAEHDAAQQEQQRIYDLLTVSDERCKAATAAVALSTQGLMLAAQAKAEDQPAITSGDVVRLKSGGPRMTVGSMSGDTATCTWSNGQTIERHPFNVATLEKSTD